MIVNELSENISIAFKAILWMFLKIKYLFGKPMVFPQHGAIFYHQYMTTVLWTIVLILQVIFTRNTKVLQTTIILNLSSKTQHKVY